MQTFLPHSDFARSVAALDNKRLGKQRVETLQIFAVLVGYRWNRTGTEPVIEAYEPKAWRNHPAVLGWVGFEAGLLAYQEATCREWTRRGFADSCLASTTALFEASDRPAARRRPAWTIDPAVHRSHQSNLIRKDPEFYLPLFPGVPADLDYLWPTTMGPAAMAPASIAPAPIAPPPTDPARDLSPDTAAG